ncbi:hypothetical protein HK101_008281 [Irineochytrium annulatum]|nr:hypothetical protein HK101_008281 [Irineochytrium annulatum]
MAEEGEDFDDDFVAQSVTVSAADYERDVQQRTIEVRSLLSRGSVQGAIKKALENPPLGRDIQPIKDKSAQLVMETLAAAKTADIPSLVKGMTLAEVDILMKFIYRGFQSPEVYNAAMLLAWHEKASFFNLNESNVTQATEVGGLGSIVRVLTDRNF